LERTWTKIFPIQPNGSGIPFVLVSQGMEGLSLARHVGPDHPVLSIQSSFWGHASPTDTIDQFAADCVTALRKVRPQGPYALGGWCIGWVVALEMARKLQGSGDEVAFVALFDARDVYRPHVTFIRRFIAGVWGIKGELARRWGEQGPRAIHEIAMERMSRFRLGPSPQGVAISQLLRTWLHIPWPGRVLHFMAAERPRNRFYNPELIWRSVSDQCTFHEARGDHNTMLLEPNVAAIAEILNTELDRRNASSV
jgi:thioesterase domain-containing protein